MCGGYYRYVEVYVPTAPLELLRATKPNCNVKFFYQAGFFCLKKNVVTTVDSRTNTIFERCNFFVQRLRDFLREDVA